MVVVMVVGRKPVNTRNAMLWALESLGREFSAVLCAGQIMVWLLRYRLGNISYAK